MIAFRILSGNRPYNRAWIIRMRMRWAENLLNSAPPRNKRVPNKGYPIEFFNVWIPPHAFEAIIVWVNPSFRFAWEILQLSRPVEECLWRLEKYRGYCQECTNYAGPFTSISQKKRIYGITTRALQNSCVLFSLHTASCLHYFDKQKQYNWFSMSDGAHLQNSKVDTIKFSPKINFVYVVMDNILVTEYNSKSLKFTSGGGV